MPMTVDELLAKIKDKNDKVRCDAWLAAGPVGAAVVKPLAAVMTDGSSEMEVARAAKRGLWKIVRYVGRPGAEAEQKAVVAELLALLSDGQPLALRREVLWMLSEIGGDEAVDPMAKLLSDPQLREDARCSVQRIPGSKSLSALTAALAAAPPDFQPNLTESLRARGKDVPGLPDQKLLPTKQTSVKPVGR